MSGGVNALGKLQGKVDANNRLVVAIEGGGTGDVVGPASATDNAIARYDGTTGKLIQDSGITIADGASGTLAGSNSGDVTLAGTPDYITLANQVLTRGAVDLAADVTGDLPYANFVPATAASKLVGRGSASGAGDMEEITIGAGLTMTATTLSASGAGTGDVVGPASATDNAFARYDSTTGKLIQDSVVIADDTGNVTGIATVTLPNTGLHLLDTNASHDLIIAPGSDLTADHTLTITTGDADRTLTIAGNASVDGTTSGTNTGDITLAGTPDYITLANQVLTRNAVDLTAAADVTGDLPLANIVGASGASVLLGRGSASGAGDFQEITLGSGLTMTNQALSASAGNATLLYAATGTSSSSGVTNLDTFALTGLTAKDVVVITATAGCPSDNITDLIIYNNTAGVVMGTTGGVGQHQYVKTYTMGIVSGGGTQNITRFEGSYAGSIATNTIVLQNTAMTTGWTVALRWTAIGGGDTGTWAWQITKFAGQ
jgi:hypothetical protein